MTNNTLKDYTLEVNGKLYSVHKSALEARSEVFAAMLSFDSMEKEEKKAVLTDIENEVFEELLTFLYTGNAPNLDKFAEKLFIALD
jgi:hypothetical protein